MLVGLLGGAVAAAVKAFQGRTTSAPAPAAPAPAWTPLPNAEPVVVPPRAERPSVSIADLQESPAPPKPARSVKKAAPKKVAAPKLEPWVAPIDGEAPPTHPIKAKMASGIYHVPGGLNYARTRPDRCYRDVEAAEADGLRPSKR
jgi:hypothetical protein